MTGKYDFLPNFPKSNSTINYFPFSLPSSYVKIKSEEIIRINGSQDKRSKHYVFFALFFFTYSHILFIMYFMIFGTVVAVFIQAMSLRDVKVLVYFKIMIFCVKKMCYPIL